MTARQIAKWTGEDVGVLVQTYQCAFDLFPGRKCNTIYSITAGAIQRATEI